MARDLQLGITTPADVRGLEKTADAVDDLADHVDDLGDATEEMGRDAERLQEKIDATQRKMRELAVEIARTDDEARRADLEKAFGDESRTLAKLRRVGRAINDVGDEAKTAERKVGDLGDRLRGLDGIETKIKSPGIEKSGGVAGDLFLSGFGKTLLNPLIGIPAVAAAAFVAPVGAAAVAAATLAGASLGSIFLGAFALRGDPALQAAASGLIKRVGDGLTKAAQPLRGPLIKALDTIGDAFEAIGPDLKAIFEAVAPHIPVLAEGVAGFLKAFTPGLVEAVKAAGPVIEQIAFALPDLGNALAQFLISMSIAAPVAADAIGKILRFVADLIRVTGDAIEFISRMFTGFVAIMKGIGQAISDVVTGFQVIFEALRGDTKRLEIVVGEILRRLILLWKGLPSQIQGALGNLGGLLYDAGRNVVQGLINGIMSKFGALRNAVSSIAGMIRDYLPFSPAKTGPLSGSGSPDIAGRKIGEMLASGMTASTSLVGTASGALAGAALPSSVPSASGGPVSLNYSGGGSGLEDMFVKWLHQQIREGKIQLSAGGSRVAVG